MLANNQLFSDIFEQSGAAQVFGAGGLMPPLSLQGLHQLGISPAFEHPLHTVFLLGTAKVTATRQLSIIINLFIFLNKTKLNDFLRLGVQYL